MPDRMRLRTILLLIGGALGSIILPSCSHSTFRPPDWLGPPALVVQNDEPHLWLLTQQEESRTRRIGGGSRTIGSLVTETIYHFALQSHDARTAQREWKKDLLELKDNQGGHTARARIFGQEGNVVWIYLNDGPVVLSASDGSKLADRSMIEQRNPNLSGLIPKEIDYYTYDNGLVITAADSRRYKIQSSDYTAETYKPASEEMFTNLSYMSTTWNGGYATADFLTRQTQMNGRWLGFYTEREAADAGDDEFGRHISEPESVLRDYARARRGFWTARIGKTREFTEGAHDRLFDLTRIPRAPEFLEAGILKKQAAQTPLLMQNPSGLIVAHRTRIDAEGRLALARLDEQLLSKWSTTLPFLELRNRFEFPDRLLLAGTVQITKNGATDWQDFIASIALADGRMQAWNVTLEKAAE
jgi:hypothetical protein